MPENELSLDALLKHRVVREITANVNPELIERRNYQPPLCKVFENPCTVLHDSPRYRFGIHPEARKQLPDIIDNPVQVVAAPSSCDRDEQTRYGRPRKIGIVFSADRRPGATTSLPGCSMPPGGPIRKPVFSVSCWGRTVSLKIGPSTSRPSG